MARCRSWTSTRASRRTDLRRIVTVSFTDLEAGGGVPKFNRDLHSAFWDRERVHYCWDDFPWADEMGHLPEWERARTLNHYLVQRRMVTPDDVVVADGFWADGLDHLPLAVSHSHGIWGHVTKDDVDRGVMPENPVHHVVQVEFRRRWISQGRHITAVSDFIAEQMRLQWGFGVDRVIDNGVDTEVYRPYDSPMLLNDLLIVHGVNDPGNLNKGWDHIVALKSSGLGAHVLSLDEAHALLNKRSESPLTKPEVLAQADMVVHPSGYEGNSMFVAETLASGVPLVGYDVGFAWRLRRDEIEVGWILDRRHRSPENTLDAVQTILRMDPKFIATFSENAREVALGYLSIERFRESWRSYVEDIERDA